MDDHRSPQNGRPTGEDIVVVDQIDLCGTAASVVEQLADEGAPSPRSDEPVGQDRADVETSDGDDVQSKSVGPRGGVVVDLARYRASRLPRGRRRPVTDLG